MKFQRAEPPALLDGLAAAKRFFAACLPRSGEARERLVVAHVDRDARCIGISEHDGDATSIDFPVRSILTDAIRLGSAGVVLAHNHPGGDPTPSAADRQATRRLSTAAEAMDVMVLDHLVFGRDDACTSMRQLGLI